MPETDTRSVDPRDEPLSRRRPARREVITLVVVTAVYVAVAARAIRWSLDHNLRSDFHNHALNAAVSNRLGILWPHFLSYWVISAPCGFCKTAGHVLGPLPFVVASLLGAKFVISYAMLRGGIGFRTRDYGRSNAGVAFLAAMTLLLGFAFSLPFPNLYRGQIPPNQWHNTTTIVVMPLALWTFWAACRYLRRPSNGGAAWIVVAGLLSVIAKPNFAMAFVPAFPVQIWLSRLPRRWKVIGLAVAGVIAFALVVQYGYTYHSADFAHLRRSALIARGQTNATWGLTISPFSLWSKVSPVIPLSIVASLLFPAIVLVARPAARKHRELVFAWLLFGFAMLAFVMVDETGRNSGAANFRWGGIVTSYILFLVSAAALLEPRRDTERRGWDIAAWTSFGLHVASGAFVLIVFARTHSYLQLHWHDVFKRW